VLVALVARASRRLRPHNDRRPDRQLVQLAAAAAVRRRAPAALVVAAAVRCLVHAGWLLRRTRWQLLQPCKLVLGRLMLRLQLRQGVAELLILRPQTPNLANQSRTTPIRSDGDRRSSESGMGVAIPSLNHIFALLTPPPPGNLPRLRGRRAKQLFFRDIL